MLFNKQFKKLQMNILLNVLKKTKIYINTRLLTQNYCIILYYVSRLWFPIFQTLGPLKKKIQRISNYFMNNI